MPADKQQSGKPFTPSLSSNFRHTRSPLTPRLAGQGSAPNSPSSAARREGFVRTRSPARNEAAGSPAMNGNITPRSAARKSRIGTESPGTPNPTRGPTVAPATTARKPSPSSKHGLGISSPSVSSARDGKPSSGDAISAASIYTTQRPISDTTSTIQDHEDNDFKFCYADDAKSTSGPPVKPLNPQQVAHDRDDQFFHASELSSRMVQQSRPQPPLRAIRSVASSLSTKSRPADGGRSNKPNSRSTSPSNASVHATRALQRDLPTKQATPTTFVSQRDTRRGSVGSYVSSTKGDSPVVHRKAVSTSTVTTTLARKLSSPRPLAIPSLDERSAAPLNTSTRSLDSILKPVASPTSMSPRSVSLNSATTAPTTTSGDLGAQNNEQLPVVTPASELSLNFPGSPQPHSPRADPAANARRERKVLDLEISNSSLLAINKTLERELRKQNTELRRFRRLSQTGRLSIAPSHRSISESTLGTVAEYNDSGEASVPSDEEIDEEINEDDLDVLSNGSSADSPTARARQRSRDERRLMLDLSKHQQLLIDSQKLSQSIKRCLTCTEQLISDGNKALDYRVNIGDIQLGGRVLSVDDELERGRFLSTPVRGTGTTSGSPSPAPERRGLLSPSLSKTEIMEAGRWLGAGQGLDGNAEEH